MSASFGAASHLSSMRKTMIRKVDPVHFFNAMGESLLTMGHQGEIIDRLLEENAELKRLLKAALLRLGASTNEPAHEDTIN